MTILQIEHRVADYQRWKKLFDSDPVDRKGSGVKKYEVFRSAEDPNHVIVKLCFDNAGDAHKLRQRLDALWKNIDAGVMTDAKAMILELEESAEL